MVIDIEFKEKEFDISGSFAVIEEFLEKKKKEGKSKSLIRNYRYDILDFCQNTAIQNIENFVIEDLEDYLDAMRARKCSGSTINRRISAIKSLAKYLIEIKRRVLRRKKRSGKDHGSQVEKLRNQIEEYEDIVNFERVKSIRKEKLPFNINELKRILEATKRLGTNRYASLSLRNYLVLKFSGIGTGARNTAVRKLKKQDLDCFSCSKQCEICIPTVKLLRKGKTEDNQEERSKIRVRIEKQVCDELYQYIHNV